MPKIILLIWNNSPANTPPLSSALVHNGRNDESLPKSSPYELKNKIFVLLILAPDWFTKALDGFTLVFDWFTFTLYWFTLTLSGCVSILVIRTGVLATGLACLATAGVPYTVFVRMALNHTAAFVHALSSLQGDREVSERVSFFSIYLRISFNFLFPFMEA